jgi:hypothetical protein
MNVTRLLLLLLPPPPLSPAGGWRARGEQEMEDLSMFS